MTINTIPTTKFKVVKNKGEFLGVILKNITRLNKTVVQVIQNFNIGGKKFHSVVSDNSRKIYNYEHKRSKKC